MKSIFFSVILFCFIVLWSCSSGKTQATPEQLNRLAQLVQSKHFKISSDVAYPRVTTAMNSLQNTGLIPQGSTISHMSLIGNENYVKIIGDSVYAELPYFGERQMNVGYNGSDNSISIAGLLQNYNVEKSSKNDSYTILFDTRTKTERFQFNIEIFSNLKTSMLVNGTTRFPIRYSGSVILTKK
ncbi:DUF4251 domain-containing protein [Psychroserpens mesophilus]|uniref:DUF4251 domain-containing protein n=1 Tax=Psychroserpens mesophilus TaxID=325473 RepID=UPI003D649744